jgi:surface protein
MEYIFNKCHKLKQIIGINAFKTNKVTNMYGMFNECNELKSLDLSNFITINVLDFGIMFQECFELTYVNISNFNFQKAKNIRWMFNKCYKLIEIKGINIINNIKKLEKNGIFDDCPKLKNIPNYEHKNIINIIKKQINIKFISVDQQINDYVICYNTDIFENVLEKIYLKYPQYKNKINFCLYGGAVVNERVSLAENKIEDNSTILIDYS